VEPSVKQKPEVQIPKYRGLVGTGRTIIAEEGVKTLYNGLGAGLQR